MTTDIVKNVEFKINEESLNIDVNFELTAMTNDDIFEYLNAMHKLNIVKFPKVNDVGRHVLEKNKNKIFIKENFKLRDKEFCCSRFMDKHPSEIDENSIVLILESPHIYEFDENFDPIAPAQGSTGLAIKNKINAVLMEIEEKKLVDLENEVEYRLILVNPVPYQTSLWHFHQKSLSISKYKTLRDKVWKEIWKESIIQDDFNIRLQKYKPKLIINACTSHLTKEIDNFLLVKFKDTPFVSTYHPAVNWNKGSYGIRSAVK